MPSLSAEARAAHDAVARGMLLARQAAATVSLARKDGGRDIVTSADVAVEDEIHAILASTFGWPVIGEERGGVAPADGSRHWLIDPICGTRNFASEIGIRDFLCATRSPRGGGYCGIRGGRGRL